MKPMKLYVVMFRYGRDEAWEPNKASRGGLDIQSHLRLTDAEHEARQLRPYHPRGCVCIAEFVPNPSLRKIPLREQKCKGGK